MDDHTKDGGAKTVRLLCPFYYNSLQSQFLCFLSQEAKVHSLTPGDLTESIIYNRYNIKQQSYYCLL